MEGSTVCGSAHEERGHRAWERREAEQGTRSWAKCWGLGWRMEQTGGWGRGTQRRSGARRSSKNECLGGTWSVSVSSRWRFGHRGVSMGNGRIARCGGLGDGREKRGVRGGRASAHETPTF